MKKAILIVFALVLCLGLSMQYTMAEELEGDITFWHSFTQGPRLENIQKTADKFMELHPKVKINIETFSWGDFYTKWTTGFSSGNLPDMSSALPNHVVEMIDYDAIVSMNPLIEDIGRENFLDGPIKEMTKDDVCYALPLYSHAQVMWYRKDLLKKYNLEVPTTWEELKIAADTISQGENGEVYGCSVPMGKGDFMASRYLNFYVRSAGETLLTADGKANLTSKACLDGIKYWVDMYKANSPKDSINFKVLDQATLYYQGKNAFDFNSGFEIGGVQANSPQLLSEIDCALIPAIDKDHAPSGYETSNIPLVVWKNSKHQDVCFEFIKFMYQAENYIPFLKSVPVGMLSAVKGITEHEDYLSDPTVMQFTSAMKTISEAIGHGTAIGMENGPVPQSGLLTSQNVIEEMFQDIIINNLDIETAAKQAEDKLNEMFSTLE